MFKTVRVNFEFLRSPPRESKGSRLPSIPLAQLGLPGYNFGFLSDFSRLLLLKFWLSVTLTNCPKIFRYEWNLFSWHLSLPETSSKLTSALVFCSLLHTVGLLTSSLSLLPGERCVLRLSNSQLSDFQYIWVSLKIYWPYLWALDGSFRSIICCC